MSTCPRSEPRNENDPLLKELAEQGINLILPPRDGILPGDLILGDGGSTIRTANWKIVTGVAVRIQEELEPSFKAMTFVSSAEMEGKFGLSATSTALETLGLKKPSLSAAFARSGATKIRLRLLAPAVRALKNLDGTLEQLRKGNAEIRPGYEGRAIYIVERIWRAKGLSLEFLDASGASVDLNLDAATLLEAQAKLQLKRKTSGQYEFQADTALIFGLTVREIEISEEGVRDKPSTAPLRFRDGQRQHVVIGDDVFVPLE